MASAEAPIGQQFKETCRICTFVEHKTKHKKARKALKCAACGLLKVVPEGRFELPTKGL